MSTAWTYGLLGNWEYPGHPITIAWAIVNRFASLAEATTIPSPGMSPAALSSSDIPGAGGNVYAALDFLGWLQRGIGWDEAVARADAMWARCDDQCRRDPERWMRGQEQADRYKPLLLARASWWKV